jgi:hypothetical protein
VPPQSRETAILAICDAVEAASRTLKHPDDRSIENLVQRIVYGKLHLGQLDESGLSMGDLRRINNSLRETIKHAHHGRIEYPWQREAAAEAAAARGGAAAPRADRRAIGDRPLRRRAAPGFARRPAPGLRRRGRWSRWPRRRPSAWRTAGAGAGRRTGSGDRAHRSGRGDRSRGHRAPLTKPKPNGEQASGPRRWHRCRTRRPPAGAGRGPRRRCRDKENRAAGARRGARGDALVEAAPASPAAGVLADRIDVPPRATEIADAQPMPEQPVDGGEPILPPVRVSR